MTIAAIGADCFTGQSEPAVPRTGVEIDLLHAAQKYTG
jgi:hypothetical protein